MQSLLLLTDTFITNDIDWSEIVSHIHACWLQSTQTVNNRSYELKVDIGNGILAYLPLSYIL